MAILWYRKPNKVFYMYRGAGSNQGQGGNSPKKGIMFYLAEEEKTLSLENSVFI